MDTKDILDKRKLLPGAIEVEVVAVLLGFTPKQVASLVTLKHLEPLGEPVSNSVKMFSSETILKHRKNPEWLDVAVLKLQRLSRSRPSQVEARAKRAKAKKAKSAQTSPKATPQDVTT